MGNCSLTGMWRVEAGRVARGFAGGAALALALWAPVLSVLAPVALEVTAGPPSIAITVAGAVAGAGADAEGESEAGQVALDAASAARKAAYREAGEARAAGLLVAAQLFGAVADDASLGPAQRAEGAFRAGEILRAQDRGEDARQRFQLAASLTDDPDAQSFPARALLELAHLARRAGDDAEALALYGRIGRDFATERRTAAHALTWTGKLLLKEDGWTENTERGVEALLRFGSTYLEYAGEAVRNADIAAVRCAQEGDRKRAALILASIRARCVEPLAKGGRKAQKLQASLDRMKIAEILEGPPTPATSGAAPTETGSTDSGSTDET